MSDDDWDGPDYSDLKPPSETHPTDYTWVERRTELYRLIEEAGHPRNLRRSQQELADRYGVSQTQISKDIQKLREYQRAKAGSRAVSTTRWLQEKAVIEIVEHATAVGSKADEHDDDDLREMAANLWELAQDTQMEYNDFLFKLGQLDEAPDELHVSGDAGEMYMEMLRQQREEDDSE